MKNLLLKGVLLTCFLSGIARGETIAMPISGKGILSERAETVDAEGKKGLVAVFLSAKCPCSNSHVASLKELAKAHPDFAFVGIHANGDEGKETSQSYFRAASLRFPVLQDTGGKLAEKFRALKTPHAFLLSPAGEVLYKGGVSNSSEYANASEHFLEDAIKAVAEGKPVAKATGRTLGCVINRGGKDDW